LPRIIDYKDKCYFQRVLGNKGMEIYKLIFDENNRESVDKFLADEVLVRALWPTFCNYSK
jgi:hypothetical protein